MRSAKCRFTCPCGCSSTRSAGRIPGGSRVCPRGAWCSSRTSPSPALVTVFWPRKAAFGCALWCAEGARAMATLSCSCRQALRSRRSRRLTAAPEARPAIMTSRSCFTTSATVRVALSETLCVGVCVWCVWGVWWCVVVCVWWCGGVWWCVGCVVCGVWCVPCVACGVCGVWCVVCLWCVCGVFVVLFVVCCVVLLCQMSKSWSRTSVNTLAPVSSVVKALPTVDCDQQSPCPRL